MKKHAGKHKASPVGPQAGQDIGALISKMQQQLVFLEKKIDILIGQSSRRPPEEKHFSKPFQNFDRSRQFEGRQDADRRERTLHKAICADCNKECEVPFKPSQDRPVYCRECFSKRKGGGSFKARPDGRPREDAYAHGRHADSAHIDEVRKFGKKKRTIPKRRKK